MYILNVNILLGVSNINFERLSKESLEVGRKLLV